MRLFAWSDLHVDYRENFEVVRSLSDSDYREDTILIAGDLSSRFDLVLETLEVLQNKFRKVGFVPGNHDLWVTSEDRRDSLEKFHRLCKRCESNGIETRPFNCRPGQWIVPIHSWYLRPEEDSGSLFVEKPGEDPSLRIWMDNYRIRWPDLPDTTTPAQCLLAHTRAHLQTEASGLAKGSVISFSHFLPRVELVFQDWERFRNEGRTSGFDAHPQFNFTRVAGCRQIEDLIRELGSVIHVYGHQHRNRDRLVDRVRYLSHCLGYPGERRNLPESEAVKRLSPLEVRLEACESGS